MVARSVTDNFLLFSLSMIFKLKNRDFIVYYVSKIEIKAKVEGLEKSEVKKKGQEKG